MDDDVPVPPGVQRLIESGGFRMRSPNVSIRTAIRSGSMSPMLSTSIWRGRTSIRRSAARSR
jgi:hypothetical protein